jgi:hypothetical protein
MKHATIILTIILLVLAVGCKKEDDPVTPQETAVRFTTTNNVKTAPTYFSFDTGVVTDSVGAWDLKMTFAYMLVDPSMPPIKYPFIGLNKARSVTAKMIDSTAFSLVNGAATSGLQADGDTTAVIGANCLNYESGTHLLTPYPNRTFVVQTGGGNRAKFKMVGYYNEAAVSGYMTIDYVKY